MAYKKYYLYKKQVSYDQGVTWYDVIPEEYVPSGDSIGTYDTYEECIARYRTVSTGRTCSGTHGVDLYELIEYQASYDDGITWTTISSTTGSLIEANSSACGYRTRTTSGTTYCTGYDKYQDVYSQVSYDNGNTWTTTATTPTLIEADSPDCGYVPPTPCECSSFTFDATSHTVTDTAQSVTFNYSGCTKPDLSSGSTYGWMLIANHEYNAETTVGYITANVSANTSSARTGILYTSLSGSTCQNLVISQQAPTPIQYRWTQSGTTCIGYDKYQNNIKEQSTDGGVTWTVVTPPEYSASTLIEADSPDCGYVPPTPSSPKYVLTLSDSSTASAECDSTSSVTQSEIGTQYSGSVVSAVIGDCVTSIGDWTFGQCTSLSSVTIPNSVTTIGAFAFFSATSLTSITIPDSVTSIGLRVLNNCTSLTSITVEATTPPTLGTFRPFDNTNNCPIYVPCASVDAYKAASGWSSYADRIQGISPCVQPKYVLTLNDSSTVTGECDSTSALNQSDISAYSASVTSAVIGNCITSIGEAAFANCSSLTSATIPDNVTSIGNLVFYQCSGLTSVTIPDSVTSIGISSFQFCGITGITIPNSVTNIASDVFYGCHSLSTVTILNGVLSIGDSTFYGCTSLTSIDIPNSVTSIGDYVFRDCSGLTSCTIGSGVTSIGQGVFQDCSSLTSIDIPNSVTSIGNQTFYSCSGLTSCTIGSGVTSIGSYAFIQCTSLSSITIPDSVTSIGEQAFCYCKGLTSITIGSGVTSIGNYAFYDGGNLNSITIYATTPPTLGNYVFNATNNCPIYVHANSVNTYKSASGWSAYASRIQAIP